MNPLKMYFLLKMGIFHCYVSLPERTVSGHRKSKVFGFYQKEPKALSESLVFFHICSPCKKKNISIFQWKIAFYFKKVTVKLTLVFPQKKNNQHHGTAGKKVGGLHSLQQQAEPSRLPSSCLSGCSCKAKMRNLKMRLGPKKVGKKNLRFPGDSAFVTFLGWWKLTLLERWIVTSN